MDFILGFADDASFEEFVGVPSSAGVTPGYDESRPTPTFAELESPEPVLSALLVEAKSHDGRDPRFCANAVWYGYNGHPGLKPRLLTVVGWERLDGRHDVLSRPETYDVAYETIYAALPDCRDCNGCWARTGPAVGE